MRVTRPGGIVSAVACFCHSDGLPHYHGRFPLPGGRRLHQLQHKLWQVYRRSVRPRLLNADFSAPDQSLLWEFKEAGLDEVQINGHLVLVSPGDSRIPLANGIAYAAARREIDRGRFEKRRADYGQELDAAGFSTAEFDELLDLLRARDEYLTADPERIRDVMEVYTDLFLMVRGTKPVR